MKIENHSLLCGYEDMLQESSQRKIQQKDKKKLFLRYGEARSHYRPFTTHNNYEAPPRNPLFVLCHLGVSIS